MIVIYDIKTFIVQATDLMFAGKVRDRIHNTPMLNYTMLERLAREEHYLISQI